MIFKKSYTNYSSYTFKQSEVVMDKPTYVGFAVLELSKLHVYETFYDKLQPYFGQESIQLHYIDTIGVVIRINTKHIIEDIQHLENIFDFSNLDENHELFNIKNGNGIGEFKIETPKYIWIDEFVALRSKA